MSNESEWPARVSDWRASGKSAREFCIDKDYSATTLYWWASRLKRNGQPSSRHKPMRLARVVRKAADEASKHAPIVLHIGPARLEIGRGADQTTLYKRGGKRRVIIARVRYKAVDAGGNTDVITAAMPPEMIPLLPRLRELRTKRAELEALVAKVVPLRRPPTNLLTEATTKRFQATLRALLLGEDQALAKNYLRFLVDQIIVRGKEVEIRGKSDAAVALLASASDPTLSAGVNSPTAVLVSVDTWLRKLDSNQRPIG